MIDRKNELRVIAFDWGDTLMKVFPHEPGPMVAWKDVEAVEGAAECLQALQGKVRLVVATNAAESSAEEVRAALNRVGLSEYFEEIYNVQKLGFSKLDPTYYLELEKQLGVPREHLLMVGDHYEADVLHPWQSGWSTAWLNPAGRAAPGLLPVHSIDLTNLSDLPLALKSLSLPSYTDCLEWHLSRGSSRSLLHHVETVAVGAYQMALWLRQSGEPVNPILAHRGGLLHDLAKLHEKGLQGPDHGELAAEILEQAGQTELAQIANRHMLFGLLEEGRQPITWEEKLVYLADKLVEGNRFVGIEARIAALRARYAIEPDLIARLEPRLNDLLSEVCFAAGCSPAELVTRLQQAAHGER